MLQACGKNDWPEYWHCAGNSTQAVIKFSDNQKTPVEQYEGYGSLLLEVYGGQVTQYISKPFTGVYQQCQNNVMSLVFRLGSCENFGGLQNQPSGEGRLDKTSGNLSLAEVQYVADREIKTTGNYSCRNLGRRYPPSVFYGNEAQ